MAERCPAIHDPDRPPSRVLIPKLSDTVKHAGVITLFVGKLGYTTSADDVALFFMQHGVRVTGVRKDRDKKFSHIDVPSDKDVTQALSLNGLVFEGTDKIVILKLNTLAKPANLLESAASANTACSDHSRSTSSSPSSPHHADKQLFASSGVLEYVSQTSSAAVNLLAEVKSTCHFPFEKIRTQWEVTAVWMVNTSSAVEKRYIEKQAELRQQAGLNRSKGDFAFFVSKSRKQTEAIARRGIMTHTSRFRFLGDPSLGVYLYRYMDAALLSARDAKEAVVFVFKVHLGRVKEVPVSDSRDAATPHMKPTPNYDAHISQEAPQSSDPADMICCKSQMYLYEYREEALPVDYPRQCLPFAVLKFSRKEDTRQITDTHDVNRKSIPIVTASGQTLAQRSSNQDRKSVDESSRCDADRRQSSSSRNNTVMPSVGSADADTQELLHNRQSVENCAAVHTSHASDAFVHSLGRKACTERTDDHSSEPKTLSQRVPEKKQDKIHTTSALCSSLMLEKSKDSRFVSDVQHSAVKVPSEIVGKHGASSPQTRDSYGVRDGHCTSEFHETDVQSRHSHSIQKSVVRKRDERNVHHATSRDRNTRRIALKESLCSTMCSTVKMPEEKRHNPNGSDHKASAWGDHEKESDNRHVFGHNISVRDPRRQTDSYQASGPKEQLIRDHGRSKENHNSVQYSEGMPCVDQEKKTDHHCESEPDRPPSWFAGESLRYYHDANVRSGNWMSPEQWVYQPASPPHRAPASVTAMDSNYSHPEQRGDYGYVYDPSQRGAAENREKVCVYEYNHSTWSVPEETSQTRPRSREEPRSGNLYTPDSPTAIWDVSEDRPRRHNQYSSEAVTSMFESSVKMNRNNQYGSESQRSRNDKLYTPDSTSSPCGVSEDRYRRNDQHFSKPATSTEKLTRSENLYTPDSSWGVSEERTMRKNQHTSEARTFTLKSPDQAEHTSDLNAASHSQKPARRVWHDQYFSYGGSCEWTTPARNSDADHISHSILSPPMSPGRQGYDQYLSYSQSSAWPDPVKDCNTHPVSNSANSAVDNIGDTISSRAQCVQVSSDTSGVQLQASSHASDVQASSHASDVQASSHASDVQASSHASDVQASSHASDVHLQASSHASGVQASSHASGVQASSHAACVRSSAISIQAMLNVLASAHKASEESTAGPDTDSPSSEVKACVETSGKGCSDQHSSGGVTAAHSRVADSGQSVQLARQPDNAVVPPQTGQHSGFLLFSFQDPRFYPVWTLGSELSEVSRPSPSKQLDDAPVLRGPSTHLVEGYSINAGRRGGPPPTEGAHAMPASASEKMKQARSKIRLTGGRVKPIVSGDDDSLEKHTPTVTDRKSTWTDCTPIVTDRRSVTDCTPIVANRKSTVTDSTPIVANHKSTVTDRTPIVANRKSTVTNRIPIVANRKSTVTDRTPIVANRKSTVTDRTPIVANRKSTVTDRTPIVANHKSTVTDRTPIVANRKSTVTDPTPIVANRKSTVTDRTPIVANHKSTVTVHTPNVADCKSIVNDRTPTVTDRKSTVTDHKSTVSDHKSTVTDGKSTVTDRKSTVTDRESIVTDHNSTVTDHTSTVTDHKSTVTDRESIVTDHYSTVTDHTSTVTDHKSTLTDHKSTVTDHKSTVTDGKSTVTDHKSTVTETLSTVDHTPTVIYSMSTVTDHMSTGTDSMSTVTDHMSTVTDHTSTVTDHKSTLTDHKSTVTDHKSTVTETLSTVDHTPTVIYSMSTVTDYMSTVTDHMSTGSDSISSLTDSLSTVTDHMSTGTDSLSTVTDHMSTGTDSMSTVTDHMSTGSDSLSSLTDSLSTLTSIMSTGTDSMSLTDSMSTGTDSMSTLADSMSTGTDSMSTVADSMSTGTDSMSLTDSMSTGTDSMSTVADSMSTGTDSMSTVADSLSTGTDSLSIGTDSLSTFDHTPTVNDHKSTAIDNTPNVTDHTAVQTKGTEDSGSSADPNPVDRTDWENAVFTEDNIALPMYCLGYRHWTEALFDPALNPEVILVDEVLLDKTDLNNCVTCQKAVDLSYLALDEVSEDRPSPPVTSSTEDQPLPYVAEAAEDNPSPPVASSTEDHPSSPVASSTEDHPSPPVASSIEDNPSPPVASSTEDHPSSPVASSTEDHPSPPVASSTEDHPSPPLASSTGDHPSPPLASSTEDHPSPPVASSTEDHPSPPVASSTEDHPSSPVASSTEDHPSPPVASSTEDHPSSPVASSTEDHPSSPVASTEDHPSSPVASSKEDQPLPPVNEAAEEQSSSPVSHLALDEATEDQPSRPVSYLVLDEATEDNPSSPVFYLVLDEVTEDYPSSPVASSTEDRPSSPVATSTENRPSSPVATSTENRPSPPVATSTEDHPSSPVASSTENRPSSPVATSTEGHPSSPVASSTENRPSSPVASSTENRPSPRVAGPPSPQESSSVSSMQIQTTGSATPQAYTISDDVEVSVPGNGYRDNTGLPAASGRTQALSQAGPDLTEDTREYEKKRKQLRKRQTLSDHANKSSPSLAAKKYTRYVNKLSPLKHASEKEQKKKLMKMIKCHSGCSSPMEGYGMTGCVRTVPKKISQPRTSLSAQSLHKPNSVFLKNKWPNNTQEADQVKSYEAPCDQSQEVISGCPIPRLTSVRADGQGECDGVHDQGGAEQSVYQYLVPTGSEDLDHEAIPSVREPGHRGLHLPPQSYPIPVFISSSCPVNPTQHCDEQRTLSSPQMMLPTSAHSAPSWSDESAAEARQLAYAAEGCIASSLSGANSTAPSSCLPMQRDVDRSRDRTSRRTGFTVSSLDRKSARKKAHQKDVADWFSDILGRKRSAPYVREFEPEFKKVQREPAQSVRNRPFWDSDEELSEYHSDCSELGTQDSKRKPVMRSPGFKKKRRMSLDSDFKVKQKNRKEDMIMKRKQLMVDASHDLMPKTDEAHKRPVYAKTRVHVNRQFTVGMARKLLNNSKQMFTKTSDCATGNLKVGIQEMPKEKIADKKKFTEALVMQRGVRTKRRCKEGVDSLNNSKKRYSKQGRKALVDDSVTTAESETIACTYASECDPDFQGNSLPVSDASQRKVCGTTRRAEHRPGKVMDNVYRTPLKKRILLRKKSKCSANLPQGVGKKRGLTQHKVTKRTENSHVPELDCGSAEEDSGSAETIDMNSCVNDLSVETLNSSDPGLNYAPSSPEDRVQLDLMNTSPTGAVEESVGRQGCGAVTEPSKSLSVQAEGERSTTKPLMSKSRGEKGSTNAHSGLDHEHCLRSIGSGKHVAEQFDPSCAMTCSESESETASRGNSKNLVLNRKLVTSTRSSTAKYTSATNLSDTHKPNRVGTTSTNMSTQGDFGVLSSPESAPNTSAAQMHTASKQPACTSKHADRQDHTTYVKEPISSNRAEDSSSHATLSDSTSVAEIAHSSPALDAQTVSTSSTMPAELDGDADNVAVPAEIALKDIPIEQISTELQVIDRCLRLLKITGELGSVDLGPAASVVDALSVVVKDFEDIIEKEKNNCRGRPHTRLPAELLLHDERDKLYTNEGSFVILLSSIDPAAYNRLLELRQDIESFVNNDTLLEHELLQLQFERKIMMQAFTGRASVKQLSKIRMIGQRYAICQDYLLRFLGHETAAKMTFFKASYEAVQSHLQTVRREMAK